MEAAAENYQRRFADSDYNSSAEPGRYGSPAQQT